MWWKLWRPGHTSVMCCSLGLGRTVGESTHSYSVNWIIPQNWATNLIHKFQLSHRSSPYSFTCYTTQILFLLSQKAMNITQLKSNIWSELKMKKGGGPRWRRRQGWCSKRAGKTLPTAQRTCENYQEQANSKLWSSDYKMWIFFVKLVLRTWWWLWPRSSMVVM